MRTEITRKIPQRSLASLLAGLLLVATACLSTACEDDKDYSRREHIEWSNTPEFDKKITALRVHVRKSSTSASQESYFGEIYIKANVEYKAFFETDIEEEKDEKDPNWIRIDNIRHDDQLGLDVITIEIQPHPRAYEERSGCISLITETEYLNSFIPIIQGYPARTGSDYDWLKYGSENPLETKGEVLISDWTTVQKDEGWESLPSTEEGPVYCYGKNGYLRLGDDAGHRSNLLTPYAPTLRSDTAALVRFNAIAYAAPDGTKDDNKLTIKIIGGGEFFDGTTSKQLTLNHFDANAEELSTAMWDNSQQEFLIVSNPKNPFTSDTRVALMSDDTELTTGNSRIFIDNFYIFRLTWRDYDFFFEKFPWETDEDQPAQ